jgi:hypothetical protein
VVGLELLFVMSAPDSVEASKRTLIVPLGSCRIIDGMLVARVRAKLSMLFYIGDVVLGTAVVYGELEYILEDWLYRVYIVCSGVSVIIYACYDCWPG